MNKETRMTQATASNAPIGRFPIPDLHGLPEDIRSRILAVQEKSGFIPTYSWCWRIARMNSAPSSPITMR
jgi:hypothetical protein